MYEAFGIGWHAEAQTYTYNPENHTLRLHNGTLKQGTLEDFSTHQFDTFDCYVESILSRNFEIPTYID